MPVLSPAECHAWRTEIHFLFANRSFFSDIPRAVTSALLLSDGDWLVRLVEESDPTSGALLCVYSGSDSQVHRLLFKLSLGDAPNIYSLCSNGNDKGRTITDVLGHYRGTGRQLPVAGTALLLRNEVKRTAWEIAPAELQVGLLLSRPGGNGDHHAGWWTRGGVVKAVVVKMLDTRAQGVGNIAIAEYNAEAYKGIRSRKCPQIVRTLGVSLTGTIRYIVFESINNGSFRDLLLRGPLPDAHIKSILRDVAAGLHFCERNALQIYDLRAAKILINSAGKVKLNSVSHLLENHALGIFSQC